MTKTVTGTYESADQIKNAREDLIATGIPQEQIFVDEENQGEEVDPNLTAPLFLVLNILCSPTSTKFLCFYRKNR